MTLIDQVAYQILRVVIRLLHASRACSTIVMLRGFESVRWWIGRAGAQVRYRESAHTVPAYRAFIRERGVRVRALLGLDGVPSIDKANYVRRFPLEMRCTNGRLPMHGIVIDESSGSSGQATNWVRGKHERTVNGRSIQLGLQARLGRGPLFFINAFALGPWATGVNLTLALSQWARVKSLGPDITKIANAIRHFGPSHHYVVLGYPPFLKQLVDHGGIDWKRYRVSMVYGGEAMNEHTRRYLQSRGVQRVYGSYGASDLDLNIGAETDLTIALRKLCEARADVAARVFRHPGAPPMIFQYNPAEFFIETNDADELLVTVCRPGYVAPKVRYNIHDVGHVMRFAELAGILKGAGFSIADLGPRPLDLPLLFHYGRSDSSVAFYGCKISPADVDEALHRVPGMVAENFQLRTQDDDEGDKRLVIAVETPGGAPWSPRRNVAAQFFDELARVNQDFRESRRMVPAGKEPSLEFHDTGCGPFADANRAVKRRYVLEGVAGPLTVSP